MSDNVQTSNSEGSGLLLSGTGPMLPCTESSLYEVGALHDFKRTPTGIE
jgi:hypothetical protein